jgi:GTPase SAR1 family protein
LRKIGGENVQICIAGNKCDLKDKRSVSERDAEAYAAQVNAEHYNTSAKQGKGIEEAFMALTKRMNEERAKRPKAQMRMTPSVSVNTEVQAQPKKKSGCC